MQLGHPQVTNDVVSPFNVRVHALSYIALPLISSGLFIATTTHGIGILPDSVAYMRIGSASHFAPLYTWLLQVPTFLGVEITTVAWWLGWLLYVVNTLLILRLLFLGQMSPLWAALGTILIICHPVFVEYHSVAMTEPLFLALVLTSILAFAKAMQNNRSTAFAAVGAIIGLGMLTRFAAAPLLPAMVVARFLAGSGSPAKRAFDCAVMIGVCAAVFGLWLVASELTSGRSTGRALDLLGNPDAAYWLRTLGSLSTMLLPAPVGPAVRLLFLAVVGMAVVCVAVTYARAWLRLPASRRAEPSALVPVVFGLLSVFYVLFLIVSVMIQYRLNLTGRFLLPLYVFVALAAITPFGAGNWNLFPGRKLAVVLASLAAIVGASNLARTALFTMSAYNSGQGYADKAWSTSDILASTAKLPDGAAIYSNAPDLIEFRLRRSAAYLPARFNHLTGRDDSPERFAQQIEKMRRRLEQGNAYVVLVNGVDWRYYLITEKELLLSVPLVETAALPDGRIYRGEDN